MADSTEQDEFTIENGVPIPPRGRRSKYPWHRLSVGESFFVPNVTSRDMGNSAGSGRKLGKRFAVRTVTEGGIKGVRVWRVE